MKEHYGKMEIDETQLKAADPDGLYLFMLEQHPYMMTPDNVAAFTGTTGQEIRKLLGRGGCRDAASASAGSCRSWGRCSTGDSSVCWFAEPAHRTVRLNFKASRTPDSR